MTYGADFSKTPAPQRRYAADICDVCLRRNDILFVFGQEAVWGDGLDSVLQLRMNPTAAADFLRTLDHLNGGTLEDAVRGIDLQDEPLTSIKEKPAKEAKAVVNIATVAIAGYETCMDFYHASPFALRQMQETAELYAEAIARVDLHTALFTSIVKKLREFDLPKPKKEGNDNE